MAVTRDGAKRVIRASEGGGGGAIAETKYCAGRGGDAVNLARLERRSRHRPGQQVGLFSGPAYAIGTDRGADCGRADARRNSAVPVFLMRRKITTSTKCTATWFYQGNCGVLNCRLWKRETGERFRSAQVERLEAWNYSNQSDLLAEYRRKHWPELTAARSRNCLPDCLRRRLILMDHRCGCTGWRRRCISTRWRSAMQ